MSAIIQIADARECFRLAVMLRYTINGTGGARGVTKTIRMRLPTGRVYSWAMPLMSLRLDGLAVSRIDKKNASRASCGTRALRLPLGSRGFGLLCGLVGLLRATRRGERGLCLRHQSGFRRQRLQHDQSGRGWRVDDQAVGRRDFLVLGQIVVLRFGHQVELDHLLAGRAVVDRVIGDLVAGVE